MLTTSAASATSTDTPTHNRTSRGSPSPTAAGRGPHDFDRHLADRLRRRRREQRMSQEDLAAALGVSFQQVQKYERGANRISFSRLVMAAQALHTPPAWFFQGLAANDVECASQFDAFLATADGAELVRLAADLPDHMRAGLLGAARALAASAEG